MGTQPCTVVDWKGILRIYCPGYTGVRGSEWADIVAGTETIASGRRLIRPEVLRSLRNFLNIDRPGYPSTDRQDRENGKRKRPTFQPF